MSFLGVGLMGFPGKASLACWESIGNHAEYNHSACLSSLCVRIEGKAATDSDLIRPPIPEAKRPVGLEVDRVRWVILTGSLDPDFSRGVFEALDLRVIGLI